MPKTSARNLPAVIEPRLLPPPAETGHEEEATVPLSHYIWLLRRHRWKILAFVFSSVVAAIVVSSRITPIYEALATIDVDRQSPQGVIGQEAARSPLNDSDQFLATQIRLIQSDSVLRPVVEKYGLIDYEEAARRAPAAGPADAEEAPVLLKKLKVTRPPSTYLLFISYRSPDPRLAAEVANGVAQSYIEHTYHLRFRASAGLSRFMEKQLEELKAKMERSSAALAQFERELNVISPEEKTSMLSARLLQLNTEYTNAQADRLRKEAAYQSVRGGALEAAIVSTQGEALRKLVERLHDAQEKFAQAKTLFGGRHPEFRKAQTQLVELESLIARTRENIAEQVGVEFREAVNREAMLLKTVGETRAEFDRLNARSHEYQTLKREAEADKKLYEELVRRIREAGINASFQNSSIRLADPARPPLEPVFPNIPLIAVLSFLLSSVVAIGAAIVGDVLDNTIRDPEQVARTLRTEVIGSLPVVKRWRGKPLAPLALAASPAARSGLALAHRDESATGFDEAIRTLRNAILLSETDRRIQSLLVTSASPGEGKTTTAVHLAFAHASHGRRTLLIDADLRRPEIHNRLKLDPGAGLVSVVNQKSNWKDVILSLEHAPALDFLPAGPPSRRAADQIGVTLKMILDEAAEDYDLVVVDAPPMLGFAEPLQMAALVDGVVIVTAAGRTSRRAVHSVITILHRLKTRILGVVLNGVHDEMSERYYYYGYYGKHYSKYYSHVDT